MHASQHSSLQTISGKALAFKGIQLKGDVRGHLLEMEVTQDFYNSYDAHAEIVYTFPLPWGAVLLDFEVCLGGRVLRGVVQGKKQAEAQYEEALCDGDAAFMIEKNTDHSYSVSLGNLAAQESCQIRFRYAQALQFEQETLRLLIPTVLAPQYDGISNGSADVSQIPSYLRTQHSHVAQYDFDVQLRIHGALASTRLHSPSHAISCEFQSEWMQLNLAKRASLDRDFVLVLDKVEHASMALLGSDLIKPDQCALMASFCPDLRLDPMQSIHLNILVDCSGSMAGDSIDATRNALHSILAHIELHDAFSLSRFGSIVEHQSRAMWKNTENSKRAAQKWIDQLQADLGGTEMEQALLSTFQISGEKSADVLMITDGEISNIDQVIQTAQASGHRVFIVGIGHSPAESHLRRIASATNGACDFVAPGEAVEPAIVRMFTRLRSPRFEHLTLEWSEPCTSIWMADTPKQLFHGDALHVYGLLESVPQGRLNLVGRYPGADISEVLATLTFEHIVISETELSRVVAAQRVTHLKALGEKAAAQDCAINYQLITELTNYILVHKRDEDMKSPNMPELHQVAQMMPAGWAGMGSDNAVGRDPFSFYKPVVYRSSAMFSRQMCASMSSSRNASTSTSSIPMFLRRNPNQDSVDEVPQFTSERELLSALLTQSNTDFWTSSQERKVLTPLGLTAWLMVMDQEQWPSSYAQLRENGVSEDVIAWLEKVIAKECRDEVSESVIVASFLQVMASSPTRQSLLVFKWKQFNLSTFFLRLRKKLGNPPSSATHPMSNRIVMVFIQDRLSLQNYRAWPTVEVVDYA